MEYLVSLKKYSVKSKLFSNFIRKSVTFTKFSRKMCETKSQQHCLPKHSVEKREIHCHANFFPSNQFIAKFFSKTLIWRNFCEKTMAVKFRNFHTVRDWGSPFIYKITWNQCISLLYILHLIFLKKAVFHEICFTWE